MKKILILSNIEKLVFFIFIIFSINSFAQTPEPRFRTYHTGQAFTAITVDLNKNVWAGTDRQGIYFLSQAVAIPQPTFSTVTIGTAPVIGTLRINSLATDKTGNIWVAHSGSSGTFNGGGVEKITVSSSSSQHFTPARDARGFANLGLPYLEREGTATLNAQQVIVDKNNTVWIAQRYHDLTSSPDYIVTPGTFSFRNADATTPFNSVSTWKDHQDGTMDSNIPYPAYSFNPTPSQTPGSRTFNIISADQQNMWTAHYGYEVHQEVPQVPAIAGIYIQARLLKCTLTGQTTGEFYTTKQAKLGTGGVFNGVYANNKKGVWVTKSIAGVGFSVLKDGKWYNINNDRIVPPGTRFNDKAIWGDKFGRVCLGTDKGLIVYDGTGTVDNPESYTLYTNTPYVSDRNVTDTAMLSNNITAGTVEGLLSPYFSWIATPSGIMRLFLPPGDVKVIHVEYKNFPFNEIEPLTSKENYIPFADLKRQTATYTPSENDAPIFAADGTQSSVLRIKTIDGVGFYANPNNYKYEIKYDNFSTVPGTPGTELYKAKYGEFTLKPIGDYGNGTTPENLTEVDVIFRHPEFIDANEFISNKNYAKFRLVIWDKRDPLNPIMIFDHPIKFSLPPVLLVHGVWTQMSSLVGIEESLISKGYSENEILKAWRTDESEAEGPFESSELVIPNAINALRSSALGVKISAGKVNLVVHSRGGLYARAYIEDLSSKTFYKDDINSLITLNTPHFGSQAANAVLDKRIVTTGFKIYSGITSLSPLTFSYTQIIPQMTISDLVKKTGIVPKKDQNLNWGANVLTVENDNLSHKNNAETNFISNLNSSSNVQKLIGVPIHAVATNFSICQLYPVLCNPLPFSSLLISSPWIRFVYELWKSLANQLPMSLDQFITHLYNGETSDAVVPNSSMKAGLSSQFISTFPGENILHISGIDGIGSASGVTTTPSVHNRIFELLKQDFKSSSSNFTRNGINPSALTYNFVPTLNNGYANRSQTAFNGGFAIDLNSFNGNMEPGGTINFNVLQANVNKLNVIYECLGTNMTFLSNRIAPLTESNNFVFTIPHNFIGNIKITVYGYDISGAIIGENSYTLSVLTPASISLQSIRYENSDITVPQQTSSEFKLLGMYSDGIERRINDLSGITYLIDNPTIIEKTDSKTIKGLSILGETTQVATIGTLTTSLNVFVIANPALLQSLITSYYSQFIGLGPVTIKWDVYQQYRTLKFTLEKSSDNLTFTPLNEQLAAGTNYNPINYSFVDDTTDEHIYYRLKLLDIDNLVTYSNVIQVSRGSLANSTFTTSDNKIILTSNPLTENTGGLFINSSIVDFNADINIYNINGRLISNKKCEIKGGSQTIPFEMPLGVSKGLYFIQLKTKEFTKTLKLLYQK